MITFASSATVLGLARLVGRERIHEVLAGVAPASIWPVTSDTIRGLGLEVAVEAPESTVPGLVRAIIEYFSATVRGGR
jgi:uroporphyrinogen III methyltransferase/synthase